MSIFSQTLVDAWVLSCLNTLYLILRLYKLIRLLLKLKTLKKDDYQGRSIVIQDSSILVIAVISHLYFITRYVPCLLFGINLLSL